MGNRTFFLKSGIDKEVQEVRESEGEAMGRGSELVWEEWMGRRAEWF